MLISPIFLLMWGGGSLGKLEGRSFLASELAKCRGVRLLGDVIFVIYLQGKVKIQKPYSAGWTSD